MPALGLALIIYSLVFFHDEMFHPSLTTLIPVVGTMLIIWFCTEKGVVGGILSSAFFRGIGLVSYSFYLWHFPVFSFSRIINSNPTLLDKMGWIALSLTLATLTYFLIEQPFRKKQFTPNLMASIVLAGAASALLVINSHFIFGSGHPMRFPDIIRDNLVRQKIWLELKGNDGAHCYNRVKPNSQITYGFFRKNNFEEAGSATRS